MALSLNHVFGRRALALVGVGAATALTSWFIFLRNRYLKQITEGKESNVRSTRDGKRAEHPTDLSNECVADGIDEPEILATSAPSVAHQRQQPSESSPVADLQMEPLSPDTAVKPPSPEDVISESLPAPGLRHRSQQPPAAIPEEEDQQTQPVPPGLSAEFLANRLAAMGKSDCANVQLVDGDSAVLARCLRAEPARALQLVGRLAQFQHHLDRLSRGGDLVVAVCETFRDAGSQDRVPGGAARDSQAGVELRLPCLLNLVNLSGVPSNQQAILDIVPDLVGAIPVPRLSQYALQLLANLALYDRCRASLVPHLSSFLAELRLQLQPPEERQAAASAAAAAAPALPDPRRLKQCLTLLSNLTSDSATCRQLLAAEDCGAGEEATFPVPGDTARRLLDSEPGARLAWVCLLGNLAREADCLVAVASGGRSLAAAVMASLSGLSKLTQKQRDKLRSSDKSTEYGLKVTALSKELKSLLRQSKVKSK